jgi:CubicO group peptidase (beta-lactamase class C family)
LNQGIAAIETLVMEGLKRTAPAITLAVYHQGELVLNRAWGLVDPAGSAPVQPETPFDFASVTKLFTVTAFLQQVAVGQVSLDDPVVSVVPELGDKPRSIAGGQDPHTLAPLEPFGDSAKQVDPVAITFRHLLTHTSGLAPWWALFLEAGPPVPPPGQPDPVSRAERIQRALAYIGRQPFVDEPGNAVHYSDNGLILLGEAVARLGGAETPAEVIDGQVLAPLGLAGRIGFNPAHPERCPVTELDKRWRGRRCQGQVHDENAAALGGIAGHAGLFGSAADVARFGQAWLEAVQGRRPEWMPQALALEATRSQVEERGLGWVIHTESGFSCGERFGPRSFGHTGFTGTSLWIDPDRELVVALFTNRVYYGRDAEAIIAFRPAIHDAICAWMTATNAPAAGSSGLA